MSVENCARNRARLYVVIHLFRYRCPTPYQSRNNIFNCMRASRTKTQNQKYHCDKKTLLYLTDDISLYSILLFFLF